jgi:hypothetical protein
MSAGANRALWVVGAVAGLLAAAGLVTRRGEAARKPSRTAPADSVMDMVLRGRYLVISHDCAGCHGGVDPSSPVWLAGVTDSVQIFKVGACNYVQPDLKPCFVTRPRNLTPDNTTGLGRYSERQIFNALRYGLRMEDTPDVEITSSTPGQGNFPEHPHYIAPDAVERVAPHARGRPLGNRRLSPPGGETGREQGRGQRWPSGLLGERVHGQDDRDLPIARLPGSQ